jgi:Tol biopolymer transport system component
MSIRSGESLLHYRIIEKVGEGGMGEVWRARDTTLDRDVAIKTLPPAFAADAERLGRFEREAKVLASLNHPHIAAIHGLHEDRGQRFLAMELVHGEDLAERLRRGAMPLDEAIACAQKIAEALEYAHERGIIHRDLKPANIKITPDGDVKVLDFGLAKALSGDLSASDPSTTPTMLSTVTSAGTAAGIILGTAAYMSPEQARGKTVDKRADTWAFGCVLYEMLTGRRLFDGETVTDVLAAVVTRDPDWTRLPAGTPVSVRRVLTRCLDKDPRMRLRDIGEARITLADPGAAEPSSSASAGAPPARLRWWAIAAAAAALVAGTAIGRYALAPAISKPQTFEFDITIPGTTIETGSFALSPDGTRLALITRDEAGNRRKGAQFPFWSPDGREIAFFAENQLSRIALDGAAARPIATVVDPRGGTWGEGDIILIGYGTGPIRKVAASGGGQPTPVTEVEKDVEDTHAWPTFLPDGKRFVFLADASTDDGHRIRLGSLDGGPTKILKKNVRSQPIVDPGGRLLLAERGQLLAYSFDAKTGTLGDVSTLIAAPIYAVGNQHQVPASAAAGGVLAYQNGSAEMDLVVVDEAGRVARTIGRSERFGNTATSPDGKRVAFEIFTDTPEKLIWVQDLERGVRTPVSQRGKMSDSAKWSADGEAVYFDSNVSGKWLVYRKVVTGGGDPETIGAPTKGDVAVLDLSRDGRWLLVNSNNGDTRTDLYLRSLGGEGAWTPWVNSTADEEFGSFSPDSRWITYTSDASGKSEVYVAPVAGGPAVYRSQISSGGGFEPRFSPDGRKIYYRSASSEWTVVDVRLAAAKVESDTPKALFSLPSIDWPYTRNLMDVLPNGSGFMTVHPPTAAALSIRVRTGK